MAKNPAADLSQCLVHLRVIELGDDGEAFGDEVTRTNNRQNRIDAKDFVSQDADQKRIRTELLIDKVNYQLMRQEEGAKGERDFDLQDSTTALACASGDIAIVVTLKNQIGRLWEELSKAPYKTLFNPTVSGTYVWHCVQAQRMIDVAIDSRKLRAQSPRESRILSSGNRIISATAFKQMTIQRFNEQSFVFSDYIDQIRVNDAVDTVTHTMLSYMHSFYRTAMIPNFFRNQSKSRELYEHTVKQNSKSRVFYSPKNHAQK